MARDRTDDQARLLTIIQTDLILQSEDLGKLSRLGFTSRRLSVRLFVIIWLCFNLVSLDELCV